MGYHLRQSGQRQTYKNMTSKQRPIGSQEQATAASGKRTCQAKGKAITKHWGRCVSGKCEEQQEGQYGWSRVSEGQRSDAPESNRAWEEGCQSGRARSMLTISKYSACCQSQIHTNPFVFNNTDHLSQWEHRTHSRAYQKPRGSPFRSGSLDPLIYPLSW